jgi:hypothetical protein
VAGLIRQDGNTDARCTARFAAIMADPHRCEHVSSRAATRIRSQWCCGFGGLGRYDTIRYDACWSWRHCGPLRTGNENGKRGLVEELRRECSHCHGHGRAYAPPDWPAPRNLRSQAGSGSDEEFILFLRLSQAVQGPPTATVAACKRHVPLYFREPGRQQRAHALPCRNRPWPTSSSLSPSFPSFVSFLSKQLRVPLAPHTHTHSLSSLLPP